MSHPLSILRTILLASLLATTMVWTGCGGSQPAPPNTGGGGGGAGADRHRRLRAGARRWRWRRRRRPDPALLRQHQRQPCLHQRRLQAVVRRRRILHLHLPGRPLRAVLRRRRSLHLHLHRRRLHLQPRPRRALLRELTRRPLGVRCVRPGGRGGAGLEAHVPPVGRGRMARGGAGRDVRAPAGVGARRSRHRH